MEDTPDVAMLIAGLMSENESSQKYAVFRLQSLLVDSEFADIFVRVDGLEPLRQAVLDTTGNTQAYSLGSLNVLLEQGLAWECCDEEVLETVRDLDMSEWFCPARRG
jgi:engulfment/cell motility protein 1